MVGVPPHAGLLLRSFFRLRQINPGFEAGRVMTGRLPMPAHRVPDPKLPPAYYCQLLQQIQSLPGVCSAGLVTVLPLSRDEALMTIRTQHDDGTIEDRT